MIDAKRLTDICTSGLGLFLTAPIIGGAALALLYENKGGVFFKQQRAGKDGKPFDILKLRTMSNDVHLSNKERVSPLGKFLRQHSIDELPQLWNVFKGDMSLVGPRPLLLPDVSTENVPADKFLWLDKYKAARESVRPGMVSLYAIQDKDKIDWTSRLATDNKYAKTACFLTDIGIICKAVSISVCGREGAMINHSGHHTLSGFLSQTAKDNPRYDI